MRDYGGDRDRDHEDDGGGRGRRGGPPKRRVCRFCVDKIETIDYKDTGLLRGFVSERGKILPRRLSGNCAMHQRKVAHAVRRGRQVALLPYVVAAG